MNEVFSAVQLAAAIEAPPRSDHWQSGETVLRGAGRNGIDHLRRNEAACRAGNPEGIHQMRVAVRRLRAVLSAFAPLLPRKLRRASDELRWLTDALGEARNLDVLALEILAPARASLPPSDGLERLAEAIDRHRQYAHAETEAVINSSHYTDSISELMHSFDESVRRGHQTNEPLNLPIGELASMVLERLYRSVRKRHKHFAKQSEEQRHLLRISLKKMRYTAELLSGLYDHAGSKQFVQHIKHLQDGLGYRNDVRVGRDAIASLTRTRPRDLDMVRAGQRILAWHEQRLASNEAELRRRLRQFLDTEQFWSCRRNLRQTKAA